VGFGGQAFDPVALDKLQHLRQSAGERLMLEVDGGVNESTISLCAQAGAGYFVAGSAIFRQPDYGVALRRLNERARVR
jgi:ribulose-phosphate 3-epimerase